MKIEISKLTDKLQAALVFIRRYVVFIFIIGLLTILTFFVFRINQYTQKEPTEDEFTSRLQTVQRPKIDQSVLDKIQQLQDQNVQVQSLFDQARDNPFSE